MSRRWKEITEQTVLNLHTLADILLKTTVDFKLVVSVHQGHVYSNDLALLDQLDQLNELSHKTYTQSTVVRPKNTIQLQHPLHKFRTYFTLCKLTANQKQTLADFLTTQNQLVRLSPALTQWLDQSFNRTQDYFFVDHSTESWVTMLSLVQPGIVRKTMHIIPAK
jgi:hypothetical protein